MVKKEEEMLRWYHWILIGLIDVLGPFSTDSYVPNQPQMRRELHTTNILTGLTLQLNWLSKGFATLVVGAMSDRPEVGRKGALLRTFVAYVIGALGCFATPTATYGIFTLIAFRVFQGVGESGTTVCTAVARDALETPERRVRVVTMITSLRLSAIAISPTIGGLIGDAYGWRSCFAGLAGTGVLLSLATFFSLPETLAGARALQLRQQATTREVAESPRRVVSDEVKEADEVVREQLRGGYGAVLERLASDPDPDVAAARGALLSLTFGFSGLLCYLANVAPLLEETFGLSVVHTALFMGSAALVTVLVNGTLAYLFGRCRGAPWLRPLVLLRFSLRVRLVSSAALFASALGPAHLRTKWKFLVMNCYLYSLGISLGFGASNTLFVQPFAGSTAGKASAIILICRTAVATGLSQLSTDVTDAFGVKGYYLFLAAVSLCGQFAWFFLPVPPPVETRRGFAAVKKNTDFPASALPEELSEHLLPHPPPESTVPDDSDIQSSVHSEP